MQVTLVFCEHAAVRQDSRLDIHGMVSELHAPGFPARQDYLTLAGYIEWDPDTRGRQGFQVNLVDAQGKSLLTVDGHSEVGPHPSEFGRPRTPLVLRLESVIFPEAGRYSAVADVGGERFECAGLTVLRTHNRPSRS